MALNDFRLQVDVDTLEEYTTTLVEFYARECMAPADAAPGSPDSANDVVY